MFRSKILILLTVLALPLVAHGADAPSTKPSAAVEQEAIRRSDSTSHSTSATTQSAAAVHITPVNTIDGKRVGLSLAVVLGMIFFARFAMKKLFPAVSVGRNSQVIRVISRSVVGPKQQFLLVQLGKRLVLVGDSGASMNPLAQIEDPDEVASLVGQLQSEASTSSAGAFSAMFRKANVEFKKDEESALQASPMQTSATDASHEEQEPSHELTAAATEVKDLMDRVRNLTKQVRQT